MGSKTPIEGARPLSFGNIYSGKFRDRNGELKAAGILTYAEGESVEKSLRPMIYSAPLAKLEPTVQKFRDFTHPRLESHRVHYGHANDPKDYEWITHGLKSDDKSGTAQDCVNPALITNFENLKTNVSENIYLSRKVTPLGEVPIKNLPKTIGRYEHTFGLSSNKSESAKEAINPDKPRNVVELEASQKHSMYVFSHEDYDAGEQKTRRYAARTFDRNKTFGLITPVYYDGRAAKSSLVWLPTQQQHERTQADSKILDDFREKHTKQLGKTLDPNKETRFIGPDHVFGLTNTADNYSVGDVIHGREESNILKGRDKERAYVASVRSHLARFNFVKFTTLTEAFKFYDKNNDGFIDKDELSNACRLSGYPLGDDLLHAVLRDCDKDKDGVISFLEFTNFLCYKDSMKLGARLETLQSDKELKDVDGKTLLKGDELIQKNKVPDGPLVPRTLANQIDGKAGSWKTTYDVINEAPFRLEPLKKRVYGVASIRNDLIAPEFKKIQDKNNYGNDGNAWSLISPSVFAQRGVYERDVLKPRSKQEISTIFKNIGIDLAPSTFEAIWSQASSKNPYGEVSVEEFRSALDQQHESINKILSEAETGKQEVECLGQ